MLAKHADGTIIGRASTTPLSVARPWPHGDRYGYRRDGRGPRAGHQVAVAKGGERIRCRVALPDGRLPPPHAFVAVTRDRKARAFSITTAGPDRDIGSRRRPYYLETARRSYLWKCKRRGRTQPHVSLAALVRGPRRRRERRRGQVRTRHGGRRLPLRLYQGVHVARGPRIQHIRRAPVREAGRRRRGGTGRRVRGRQGRGGRQFTGGAAVLLQIGRDGSAIELLRDSDVADLTRDVEARKVLPVAFGRSADPYATEDHCLDDCDRKGALECAHVLRGARLIKSLREHVRDGAGVDRVRAAALRSCGCAFTTFIDGEANQTRLTRAGGDALSLKRRGPRLDSRRAREVRRVAARAGNSYRPPPSTIRATATLQNERAVQAG